MNRMKRWAPLLLTLGLAASAAKAWPRADSPQEARITVRGRVIDAATGEPIVRVQVSVIDSERSVTTGEGGVFTLADLPSGETELYVTTIGYGLVKKKIWLKEDIDLEIALSPEAAPLQSQVTVTAGPFVESEPNLASEYSLNKTELQKLSTILVSDPIRAAQALPGVSGNDDFRSEFSLRGAGFRRIALFLDQVLLPANPVHTDFADDNAGSISILNAEQMSSATILSGAFPAGYGDGTAGVFHLETREPNREKLSGRIASSLLSSSAVFDGPFKKQKGGWLLTARKSYLGYILDLLEDEDEAGLSTDFVDAQFRATYDWSKHRFGITGILGSSEIDQSAARDRLDLDDILKSRSDIQLGSLFWNYGSGPRFESQSRVFAVNGDFINENRDGVTLAEGRRFDLGVRQDFQVLIHPEHRVESGVYFRSRKGRGFEGDFILSQPPAFVTLNAYDRRGNQDSYYAQDTWSSRRLHLTFTGGVRFDRSRLTGESVVTPRAALGFGVRANTRISLGWGQYNQFPDFTELYGSRGNPGLRAERATHYNARVEHFFGEKTRLRAEAYDREDKALLFSLNDLALRNGAAELLRLPFGNSLYGHARGLELSLHRRSANRLAGFVSYAYSRTRLRDARTGLEFVSDFDQRHTVSGYGAYRMAETLDFSAFYRFGSGLPMVGFYQEVESRLVLSAARNQVRLPTYSRLDLRVGKAFHFHRWKLTLLGEVLNALGRDNFRQEGPGREKLIPLVPSIGVSIDF